MNQVKWYQSEPTSSRNISLVSISLYSKEKKKQLHRVSHLSYRNKIPTFKRRNIS